MHFNSSLLSSFSKKPDDDFFSSGFHDFHEVLRPRVTNKYSKLLFTNLCDMTESCRFMFQRGGKIMKDFLFCLKLSLLFLGSSFLPMLAHVWVVCSCTEHLRTTM